MSLKWWLLEKSQLNLKLKMTDEEAVEAVPKKRMNRVLLYTLETLGVLFVLVFLGFMGLLIRIHASPLDVSFAKDYVLAQIQDAESDTQVRVESLALYWPKFNDDLYLSATDVRVLDKAETEMISVDQIAVGVDKAPLFVGRANPKALVVQSPVLSVARDAQGNFDIGFGAMKAGVKATPFSPDQTVAQQIVSAFYSNADGALSALKTLEIWDATVQVRDAINDVSFDLKQTDFIVTRHAYGLVASSKVSLPGADENDPVIGIYADVIVPRNGRAVRADVRVDDAYAGFFAPFVGEADRAALQGQEGRFGMRLEADLDGDFMPQSFDFVAVSPVGKVVVPDLYPSGMPYTDLNVQARYRGENKAITIEQSGVSLRGVPVKLGVDLVWNDGEVTGPVRVDIAALSHDQLKALWPESLVEDNSYVWAVKKITKASFKDVFAQFYVRAGQGVETDVQDVLAGFGFKGGRINYRAPLTPVTQATGRAVFNLDQERLDVDVSSARLKDMTVSNADIILTDIIEAGQGKVDIKIKLAGALKTALRYLQDEPIGADVDMDLAKVQGQTDLDLHIVLPLLKDLDFADVQLGIKGRAREAVLPGVVKDLDLTGGPFDIAVAKGLLTVKGKGQLNNRAVDAVYEQYLSSKGKPYSSRIKASIVADPVLRKRFGIDLDDFLEGSVPVEVTYKTVSPKRSTVDVVGDLKGARVFAEAFGYEKPVGVAGSLGLQAVLSSEKIKEIKGLNLATTGMAIRDGSLGFKAEELSSGVFPYFEVGQSKGRVEFEIAPEGAQRITMDMAFLDLRPFLDKEEEAEPVYDDPPRVISIKAAQMRASDYPVMTNGKFYMDIDSQGKFNQIEMDGVAGSGDIYLRYKPDETGKRVFRLEADDAGKTLEAFDLYDKIRGGKLVIYGEPIRGVFDRNLVGKAEITNFRVVKAPGLAKLMGAMSLPGVLNLLNNDGLVFSKLEADFNWLYRRDGSLLVLKEGRTSGNSVGLTFDGTFDNAASTVDLSGTLVPLSGLNNLVSSIPIVGQILSGGTDSVFAATYTMKGATDDPKVVVNPLAALTPGILRRIFFEQK